jgi:hypothetical protein
VRQTSLWIMLWNWRGEVSSRVACSFEALEKKVRLAAELCDFDPWLFLSDLTTNKTITIHNQPSTLDPRICWYLESLVLTVNSFKSPDPSRCNFQRNPRFANSGKQLKEDLADLRTGAHWKDSWLLKSRYSLVWYLWSSSPVSWLIHCSGYLPLIIYLGMGFQLLWTPSRTAVLTSFIRYAFCRSVLLFGRYGALLTVVFRLFSPLA